MNSTVLAAKHCDFRPAPEDVNEQFRQRNRQLKMFFFSTRQSFFLELQKKGVAFCESFSSQNYY